MPAPDVDLLGRQRTAPPVDRPEAEEAFETLGMRYKVPSLILRHEPSRVGVTLDEAGWVDVEVLLAALGSHGRPMSREQLERVVRSSGKQRFALDEPGSRIRADQGHSVEVDLGLPPSSPPERLLHGTPLRNLHAIVRDGLLPGHRHAVHLSPDVATAQRVGARRGACAVLVVDALAMHEAGHCFTVSVNGVWLVSAVPPSYLHQMQPEGPPCRARDCWRR